MVESKGFSNSLVYDFSDYRAYLRSQLNRGNRARKGALGALASALPCQSSYLSRVMSGRADLSAEQADSAARHFGLSTEESYFFLLLVQLARAGTPSLRSQYQRRISQLLDERLDLQKRVGVKQTLSKADEAIYYSLWVYSAVHVMSGIPRLQSKQMMARELGLPLARISEILEFLISVNLVKGEPDGRFSTGIGKIHLQKHSPMIIRHHSNWRNQALRSLESGSEDGIHYSVLLNTSKKDEAKLRASIAQFIEEFMRVAHTSPDEVTNCFALDFFSPRS